jgi:hypothetical protein
VARRPGLQAEVLASLALVMAAATGVLAIVLVTHHERVFQPVLASALSIEARSPHLGPLSAVPGTRWWLLDEAGRAHPRKRGGEPPDAGSLELGREARAAGTALLQIGTPGEPARFAVPLDAGGRVAIARLPRDASRRLHTAPRRVALAVLLADAAIFTVFGGSLLRRRLVLPLRRLRDAAEAVARGEAQTQVPVEGTRETADLAAAFNVMTEALALRTGALEKAVADLRGANRELRQTRAGLDRAERLAAVGRLAAGVAHEVGNPMGAILAFLDLAARDPGLSPDGREHLTRAAREGERVREILRQLLDFSRPARGVPGPLDLAAVAEETAALVRAQRRYAGISIEVVREPGPTLALADSHAVTQILLNLLLNAAVAVDGRSEPRIELRVGPAPLHLRAGEDAAAASARREPDAVCCRVSDNGPGVSEADRERIFDPFFTTKDPGEGTGLGLSNALRLAEENGGRLDLESGGEGGTFALRLPRAVSAQVAVRAGGST